MNPNDKIRAAAIKLSLERHSRTVCPLPGIASRSRIDSLVAQIVDSLRRVEFIQCLFLRDISVHRSNPHNIMFDPLKASIIAIRGGNVEEAFWLVFLATHFGKHQSYGWELMRLVYGEMGNGVWNWNRVAANPAGFLAWLTAEQANIAAVPNAAFSNHRKYESVSHLPRVFAEYIAWISANGGHLGLLQNTQAAVGQNPEEAFDFLFKNMPVYRFGRLGKFDFLTMLGKLGLAPINPGSAYMSNATGPLSGARLLFANDMSSDLSASTLDAKLIALAQSLNVGMQVIEDSLCNWQKSPDHYVLFRG